MPEVHETSNSAPVPAHASQLGDGQRAALQDDRVAELEAHLRRIVAELRAAGVMEDLDILPPANHQPPRADLTSRERQILIRLRDAQRVSQIAAELYVSPSTVRNHLATIFRKFGVHSQAELLAVLRGQP
jgi:DNA-binding CsgD family transcriptional regulator